MRMLLVALLLGNLLLGVYNAWPPAAVVIDPGQRELTPERIHLLNRDEARKMSTRAGPRASLD